MNPVCLLSMSSEESEVDCRPVTRLFVKGQKQKLGQVTGGDRHEVSDALSDQEVQDSSDDIDNSDSPSHSRNSSDSSSGSARQSSVGEGEDEENVEDGNLSLHLSDSDTAVSEPESVPRRSRRNRRPPVS